ncbi:MAG: SH3 domain-containing protein [Cyanobacteria bacterium P01_F01_bin.150]
MQTSAQSQPVVRGRYSISRTVVKNDSKLICVVQDSEQYNNQCLLTKLVCKDNEQAKSLEGKLKTYLDAFVEVDHPQIQGVNEYFVEGKELFIVQEYIDGVSCNELIQTTSQLDEYETVQLLNKVLPALKYMHEDLGINHGNVSLESIVVQNNSNLPVLTNFGYLSRTESDTSQPLSVDSIQKDLHDLALTAIALATGKSSEETLQELTHNGLPFSDQRASVLTRMIDVKGVEGFTSAASVLQKLNTQLPSSIGYERKPISSAWYVAGGILLVVTGTIGTLLTSPQTPIRISTPGQEVPEPSEKKIVCPAGNDILAIGCGMAVEDPDSIDFDEGSLSVKVASSNTPDDRLLVSEVNVSTVKDEESGTSDVVYNEMVIATFTEGSEDGSLEFAFTQQADKEAVRALLNDIVYTNVAEEPTPGKREIEFLFTDGDGGNSGTLKTAVGVYASNKAPSLTIPSEKSVQEDTRLSISGITVSDPDAENKFINIRFTANQGAIAIKSNVEGGIIVRNVQGNGSNDVVVSGPLAQINKTLSVQDAITFTPNPNYSGQDNLKIVVDDRGKSGSDEPFVWPINAFASRTATKTIPIGIEEVNDSPVLVAAYEDEGTVSPDQGNNRPIPPTNLNATVIGKPSEPLKNVRAGIDTNAQILFKLSIGERIEVIDSRRNSDGFVWYKIYSPTTNQEGWIASHLVEFD